MSGYNVAPLENLVEQFERMPGIGNKTAQRLAYYVLNLSKTEAEQLAGAVMDAHTKIHYCSKCCNLTDKDLCPVCANPARDHSVICVVETPRDATAIENTHEFKGVYHVLHGSISPLNDIGPDNLTIKKNCLQGLTRNRLRRSLWQPTRPLRAMQRLCIFQSS